VSEASKFRPPADVHNGAVAGYSGTPQARKLGIEPGQRVNLDQVPAGWHLTNPPPDLMHVEPGTPADVVLSFFTSADQLPDRLLELVKRIYPDGALWIAWPRRAGGHTSDINGDVVRACALPLGVVDVKVAAIDDDWSGQRLVWRVGNR
jgi:hypothetical protein